MASSQYPYSPLLGNYEPQKDPDGASISNHSTIGSKSGPRTPKQKHRVRFTPDCESLDGNDVRTPFDVRECGNEFKGKKPLPKPRINPAYSTKSSENSKTYVPGAVASEDITDSPARAPIPEAPSSSKDIQDTCSLAELHNCSGSIDPAQEISRKEMDIYDGVTSMAVSQPIAQERAKHLSRTVRDYSSSDYKGFSPLLGIASSPTPSSSSQQALDLSGIPMKNLQRRTRFSVEDDTDEDEEAELPKEKKPTSLAITVKQYIRRLKGASWPVFPAKFFDDQANPDEIESENRPWRRGPLAQVINMYKRQGTADFVEENYSDHPAIVAGEPASVAHARRCVSFEDQFHEGPCRKSSGTSLGTSGSNTPALGDQRWYKNEKFQSTGSLANLKTASKLLINPDSPGSSSPDQPNPPKPTLKTRSSMAFHAIFGKSNKETPGESMFILEHIRDTETRQLYLLKLCNALMACGAPTHRLEEYMRFSANVLRIQGQFLYIPGCMIVSFEDPECHTTEVKIVRSAQGVNLSKLKDAHDIYKEVVHDVIGADVGLLRLDELVKRKPLYGRWAVVGSYGLASGFVGPFAFGARFIDFPFCFLLGAIVGFLQQVLAPKSDLYSNIVEISAAVLTSFIARGFGSIRGGQLLCFSAMAQSAIALILPGYAILCGSLELQSKNIVAGSVRLVYAVIFSLFLGFGITIGTSFFGGIYSEATSALTCQNSLPLYKYFWMVPLFTIFLIIANQGRVNQMPMMVITSCVGFAINHFSSRRFSSNAQISNTLGALGIGFIANLYSRFFHGLAAATLLPAIFVQVPSGLAAGGSLISGVTSANRITNHTSSNTTVNGTAPVDGMTQGIIDMDINTMVFNVGFSMIQVAIGIAVGLSLSALVLYPCGKKRSALFSF